MPRPILENVAFWWRLGVVASALWVCIALICTLVWQAIDIDNYLNEAGFGALLLAGVAAVWIICLGVPWLARALKRD